MKELFKEEKLARFTKDIVKKLGLGEEEASVFSDSLIIADLRGVASHGVIRLPTYVERVETGVLNPRAEMIMEQTGNAAALFDANNGFGQIAGHRAMSYAIEKAGDHGIGFVAVKNSNHFGMAAYYAMMALEAGMIGLVLTNSSPAMNPFGTIVPLLGTNPLAIAVPAGNAKPIVLDMSTSVVARGKIRHAALTGKDIPVGWAVDAEGKPTTDAKKALKGSLEPIGGPKGSGLSLIIDLLCGVLTGSSLTGEVKTVTDMSGCARTGHVFCAIDIAHFRNVEAFKNDVDAIIAMIKGLPPRTAGAVYMPGEIEFNLTAQRKQEGIPLDEAVIETLNSVAERYSVARLS